MQAEFIARLAGQSGQAAGAASTFPDKRFNVYRNNVFIGLIETLQARYPVVARLVGEEFFAATARLYASAHPPKSPALFEYGGGFADFLRTFEPARSLPYLPDIAALEWLRHEAYHAPDAAPMNPQALVQIPPGQIGGIVLRLHPSAGLLLSEYPVYSIWETNSRDEEVRRIGRDHTGEAALIVRPALEVVVMRLAGGAEVFLECVKEAATLADAAQHAEDSSERFSLAETLGALLASGAFSGFDFEYERGQGEEKLE